MDIDFVVLWVDSNDPQWQREKARYTPGVTDDIQLVRYQDWDNIKYWFRAVAKYAPWVRKVHFVTCGQIPSWLNVNHPKIHLVRHSDYMPKEALPVFNSSAIEVGINKIEGLSDRFVFFNDDMFITDDIAPNYYFDKGLPVDLPGFIKPAKKKAGNVFSSLLLNNSTVIQKHFKKREIVKGKWTWWFNPLLGKTFARNVRYYAAKGFPGFIIPHLSTPYLKSDFDKVWDEEGKILTETQYHRFRNEKDVTHFLFRNWRMCEGNYVLRRLKGKYFSVDGSETALKVADAIRRNRYPEICINEVCSGKVFEEAKQIINAAFAEKLCEKCEFEI